MTNAQPIWCDESGFTGNNLLARDQPIFAYAGVAISDDEAAEIVARAQAQLPGARTELKASRLLRSKKGRETLASVLHDCTGRFKVVVHNKKFALACQMYEWVLEPLLHAEGIYLYELGVHLHLASRLYIALATRTQSAEELFESFERLIRERDHASSFPLTSQAGEPMSIDSLLLEFSTICAIHRESISKELDSIRSDARIGRWLLDLSTTSLHSVLSAMSQEHDVLDVYYDDSKPLFHDREVFRAMVGNDSRATIEFRGKQRMLTYNLRAEPQASNSERPGIQLADLAAGTFRCIAQGEQFEQRAEVLDQHSSAILDDCIVFSADYIDLSQPRAMLNAAVLHKLMDNAVRGKTLGSGLPEFIEVAAKGVGL